MGVIELDPDPHLANILLNADFFKGFSGEAIITLIVLVLMLIISGLISGSETAFFSLQPSDIHKLNQHKGKNGKRVLALRDKPKKLLATVLISNNFINVGIVVISTHLTTLLFNLSVNPLLTFLVQIVIVTSFILIFGEILPKIYANKKPVPFALMMAGSLEVLMVLLRPLSILLVKSTSFVDVRLAKKQIQVSLSDLSDAIDITVDETTPEDEKMILKGIATFGEKEASELMRSRVNVTAVELATPFSELLKIVVDSGFSRIPVYDQSFDQIKGILYIKDLLPLIDNEESQEWQNLLRPAFFVPENKKVNDLLQEFREKKIHMAIVVDEYGGTSGIITMEDILEEIVGEINDEFDKENEAFHYKKINDQTYIFDAQTMLNDLCKILGIDDEFFDNYRGESDSLGGLILELAGKIPRAGEKITLPPFTFEILSADLRKINRVKVTILDTKEYEVSED
ncbi:MAG: gliding motility-associated protein GldE [Bacteroidales bacterium]|nr:gliding motility-associated protein GldE [Bacteroidales bacterium]